MLEVIFLFALGLLWLVFASIQDAKTTEVANWLSFSLIIFALGTRFFYSLFIGESFLSWNFFYFGLVGLGVFFVLENIFYYTGIFGGGDAKLLLALGAILPIGKSFFENSKLLGIFLMLFLFVASIYGIVYSIFIASKNFKNFKKEFLSLFRKHRFLIYSVFAFGLILMAVGFYQTLFFILGVIIFIFPYLFIYTKAIEASCMVKEIKTKELMEGDWLYKSIRIRGSVISSKGQGLSEEQIRLIRKHYKKIKIKQGIVFVPVFLITYIIFFIFSLFL